MKKRSLVPLFLTTVLVSSCGGPRVNDDYIVEQRYIHKYGMDLHPAQWEDSGRTGQVVNQTKDGVKVVQTFEGGQLEGETTYTYPNSDQTQRVVSHSQNQPVKTTDYYISGHPERQVTNETPDTKSIKQWYENGTISISETFENGLLKEGEYFDTKHQRSSVVQNGSGIRTQRDGYGHLVATETVENGHVRSRTVYYPTGSPKEIIPYQNDHVDGAKKTFLPGGEPETIETWVAGKQEGITTIFHEGVKQEEIPFVNGIKSGVGKVYKDGTTVVQDVTWKDNMRHGPTTIYSGTSAAPTTEWYYKDKKVTKGYYDSFTTPSGAR